MAELSVANLFKLSQIYNDERWVNCDVDLEKFCNYLRLFNEEQQDLLVELSTRFVVTDERFRRKLLRSAIEKVEQSEPYLRHKTRFVTPLKQQGGPGGDSAPAVYYEVKSLRDFGCASFANIDSLAEPFKSTYRPGKHIIYLVDDYIGTGRTVIDSIRYVLNLGYEPDDLAVFVMVAQQEGLNAIKEEFDISIECGLVMKKGISDYGGDVVEKKKIMTDIEDALSVDARYRFGFGQAEALVRLRRTPNNVFPVFWLPAAKSGLALDPPFLRK